MSINLPLMLIACVICTASMNVYAVDEEVVVIGNPSPGTSHILDSYNSMSFSGSSSYSQLNSGSSSYHGEHARRRGEAVQKCYAEIGTAETLAIWQSTLAHEKNITDCGSIASGFTGNIALTFGPVQISGGYTHGEKVAHCKDVARANFETMKAAINLISDSKRKSCRERNGFR